MKRTGFFLIATLIFCTIATISALYIAGSKLSAPVHRSVGQPPKDLNAEKVSFASAGRKSIKGWLVRSHKQYGNVVLMHGIRGDRRLMAGRAKFLHANGYSVLLFDFQAHGESEGDHITFGCSESRDARAAVNFMRSEYPLQPVAVIGQSLGAASCLIGDSPINADTLILESVYPTIEEAVANRLEIYLGKFGRYLTKILIVQLQWRFDIDPGKLRPIEGIKKIRCPVLIAGGGADLRTTLSETKRIYEAAPKPKELWIIQNAGHVDLYSFAKQEYEERILGFLKKYLKIR
ncbi:MAG: alpha/beta fold hydrolase [Desulfobacterales bacterium]|nr:alpha/beta fold hydrolase [Desulfobacterales bacterium]